jgi:hypothetical protein
MEIDKAEMFFVRKFYEWTTDEIEDKYITYDIYLQALSDKLEQEKEEQKKWSNI